MQKDRRTRDGGEPEQKTGGGQDRNGPQAGTSSPEEVSVSPEPVPLFLVPQAVAAEIRRHGAML